MARARTDGPAAVDGPSLTRRIGGRWPCGRGRAGPAASINSTIAPPHAASSATEFRNTQTGRQPWQLTCKGQVEPDHPTVFAHTAEVCAQNAPAPTSLSAHARGAGALPRGASRPLSAAQSSQRFAPAPCTSRASHGSLCAGTIVAPTEACTIRACLPASTEQPAASPALPSLSAAAHRAPLARPPHVRHTSANLRTPLPFHDPTRRSQQVQSGRVRCRRITCRTTSW